MYCVRGLAENFSDIEECVVEALTACYWLGCGFDVRNEKH